MAAKLQHARARLLCRVQAARRKPDGIPLVGGDSG